MRFAAILSLALLFLAGCGKSHLATHPPAAEVVGASIQWRDVAQYVDYALAFYAHTGPAKTNAVQPPCTIGSSNGVCVRLQSQVLRRLLEEAVVRAYARMHRIALSTSERARVGSELHALAAAAGPTSALLARRRLDLAFLRKLLWNELLVQKVEDIATLRRASAGPSYHLLTVSIPIDPLLGKKSAYKSALDLATFGEPIPATGNMRVDWKAAFRLPPRISSALLAAKKGDYVGPFRRRDRYLVVEMLGKGIHRYGRPARTALQTLYFRQWLTAQIASAHPRCFTPHGAQVSCPSAQMNDL